MLRRSVLAALVLLPALAHADVYVPRPTVRAALRLRVAGVSVESGDAPQVDRDAARSELRQALARAQGRIDRCVPSLTQDPLRGGSRTLVGRVTFSRSGRPSEVAIARSRGIPRAAEACVLEAVRAVQIATAPRGTVTLAFTYRVGY